MRKHVILHSICVSITVSFLFAPASVSAAEGKPVKVFLLGGQSNMVGSGQAAELKPPYSEPFPKVREEKRKRGQEPFFGLTSRQVAVCWPACHAR